ncbi:MAG TPA: hypothetical protein VJV39_01360 [Dongiaceae bacterium]|nr:hypothetical protein [Dongiaceae bacterium]
MAPGICDTRHKRKTQAALTSDHIQTGELKVHAIANGFPESEAAVSKVYKCNAGSLKTN